MSDKYWCRTDCKACASGTYCSCGLSEFCDCDYWVTLDESNLSGHNFCPQCGDKLNADGTVESRAEADNILGHLQCTGCLYETQSDHHDPCSYCKRKHEDEYVKQEAAE